MAVLLELTDAIRFLVSERGRATLDLLEVAALLREQFPTFTMVELAQQVADVGVKDGARFLSWESPPEA